MPVTPGLKKSPTGLVPFSFSVWHLLLMGRALVTVTAKVICCICHSFRSKSGGRVNQLCITAGLQGGGTEHSILKAGARVAKTYKRLAYSVTVYKISA